MYVALKLSLAFFPIPELYPRLPNSAASGVGRTLLPRGNL